MKEAKGVVLSAKMKRAVLVRLDRLSRHPKYGKYILKRTKVMARDEKGCKEGDVVTIAQTRPLSRRIRWRVTRVIGRDLSLDRGGEISTKSSGEATDKSPQADEA